MRSIVAVLALAGAAAVTVVLAFASAGISARPEPAALEAWAARRARDLLIPDSARRGANPLDATPETVAAAREHFLEHCALCHGKDGRGDTPVGRGLHPRAPDLTLPPTQDLSDGELFWIIENGIKLTGMPAFGKASPVDDEHAWQLVLWIRRLPQLTREEIRAMETERDGVPTGHGPHRQGHDPR